MTELDIAKLIVKKWVHLEAQRIFNKEKADFENLDANFTIPANRPTIPNMTDSQLDALKEALEESLARVDILEGTIKAQLVKVDNELVSRQ